jgi:nucleotidyltransferase/DNA polymerase involved in DNA repair
MDLLWPLNARWTQVEELRDPSLKGKAVAVQQHQDIIAVNYPARAAGVKKHMLPAEVGPRHPQACDAATAQPLLHLALRASPCSD